MPDKGTHIIIRYVINYILITYFNTIIVNGKEIIGIRNNFKEVSRFFFKNKILVNKQKKNKKKLRNLSDLYENKNVWQNVGKYHVNAIEKKK